MSVRLDTGWRKVAIGLGTIAALATLQALGRLDVISGGMILGVAGALIGVNILGYRSGR